MQHIMHNKIKGVFITGTDTGVGKTWVSRQLILALRNKQHTVMPYKPIESGWPTDISTTDAYTLAEAAGKLDLLDTICPYRFPAPLSPPRAAALEGARITQEQVITLIQSDPAHHDLILVEGAGGFYSPLTENGLNADIAEQLSWPVIIIAEDKLGCINHTLLTLEAIQQRKLTCAAIVLNLHKKNEEQIKMNNLEDLSALVTCPVYHTQQSNVFDTLANLLMHS